MAATIGDIDAASDEASLLVGVEAALDSVRAELGAHTPALTLAAAWSEVLRHSVASAVRIVSGDEPWTWFVSGSVARGEVAPGSDVETMVVLDDDIDEEGKIALLARAADVHALLERCGVRGDANGVLASRPRFCRRMTSWSEGIEAWTADPREDRGVVMTGLLADSTGVPGQGGLGEACTSLADGGRGGPQLSRPVGDAAGRDDHAGRLSVPVADVHDAERHRRPEAGRGRPRREDRAVGGAVGRSRMRCRHSNVSTPRLRPTSWTATTCRACGTVFSGCCGSAGVTGSVRGCVASRSAMWCRCRTPAPQERAVLRSVAREVAGISRKLTYLASTQSFR